jgi:hypothetical protein
LGRRTGRLRQPLTAALAEQLDLALQRPRPERNRRVRCVECRLGLGARSAAGQSCLGLPVACGGRINGRWSRFKQLAADFLPMVADVIA